jgi:hypothetical protein
VTGPSDGGTGGSSPSGSSGDVDELELVRAEAAGVDAMIALLAAGWPLDAALELAPFPYDEDGGE